MKNKLKPTLVFVLTVMSAFHINAQNTPGVTIIDSEHYSSSRFIIPNSSIISIRITAPLQTGNTGLSPVFLWVDLWLFGSAENMPIYFQQQGISAALQNLLSAPKIFLWNTNTLRCIKI